MAKDNRFEPNDLKLLLDSINQDFIKGLEEKNKYKLYNTFMNILRDCGSIMPNYYEELHFEITEKTQI